MTYPATTPPAASRPLWLTRCHGDRYMLTYLPPVIARIVGTRHHDAFEDSGEPISIRHLCEGGVMAQLGLTQPLKPLTPTRVWLAMEFLEPVELDSRE